MSTKLNDYKKALEAVLPGLIMDNVKFKGTNLGDYNFSNCFDGSIGLASLKRIGIANLTKLNKLKGERENNPFEKRKSRVSAEQTHLERVCEGLICCYDYLHEAAAVARLNEKLRRENKGQIEVLEEIKAKKVLGKLENKSIKSIDSMIAKLKKEEV